MEELVEQPTVKTAVEVVEKASGRGLSRRQKEAAHPLVHFSLGALLGGVYGALSGRSRKMGGLSYAASVQE